MANGVNVAGFAGSVDQEQWSKMVPRVGNSIYGVVFRTDCQVIAASGDRVVRVSRTGVGGGVWGWGVFCEFDATTDISLPLVTSGSRWDMIVLRRNWTTKTVTPVRIAGTSTKALPSRTEGPGTIDDQPLALVQVTAGSNAITTIVDLRVWAPTGGAYARDELVRDYMNDVGTEIEINGIKWRNRVNAAGSGTQWTQVGSRTYEGFGSMAAQGSKGSGLVLGSIQIPDPGFRYRLSAYACLQGISTGTSNFAFDIECNSQIMGRAFDAGTIFQAHGIYNGILSGTQTVVIRSARIGGSGNFDLGPFNRWFRAMIHPA